MDTRVDNIVNSNRFKHLLTLSYDDIVPFVFEYIKKHTFPVITSYTLLAINVLWIINARISISGVLPLPSIMLHTAAGIIVLPLLYAVPHELLHIIPYYLGGARNIRIGADWKQYYFYVTAHHYPVRSLTFIIVALFPFIIISSLLIWLIISVDNPLWSWSILCSLFVHFTMCAGDIALVNFYWINRDKKIITWDDADLKEAYFYEELGEG